MSFLEAVLKRWRLVFACDITIPLIPAFSPKEKERTFPALVVDNVTCLAKTFIPARKDSEMVLE